VKYLREEGIFSRAAAMTDPSVMSREEREILINRLSEIDRELGIDLEEEEIDAYETTISRVKAFQDSDFSRQLEKRILGRQ
jgi:hypothetical protein